MTGPTTPVRYGPGNRSGAPRRLDASLTLLREVMERPLDPGYGEAAARRRPATPRRTAVTVVLAIVAGYLLSVAVAEVRAPLPDTARATERLREEIHRKSADVAAREAANAGLRASIAAAQEEALRDAG